MLYPASWFPLYLADAISAAVRLARDAIGLSGQARWGVVVSGVHVGRQDALAAVSTAHSLALAPTILTSVYNLVPNKDIISPLNMVLCYPIDFKNWY